MPHPKGILSRAVLEGRDGLTTDQAGKMSCSLLTPPVYDNLVCVSHWLRRWGVPSWAVLVLGEVPGRRQSFMNGRMPWLQRCPVPPVPVRDAARHHPCWTSRHPGRGHGKCCLCWATPCRNVLRCP